MEEVKLDLTKVRKGSKDYSAMTDEQRAQWNEYQKIKQRDYRKRRKAEKEAMEEKLLEHESVKEQNDVSEEQEPTENVYEGVITKDSPLYICSDCGTPLYGMEDECPNCGVLCDWRGTALEDSPDIVVCDLCGFAEKLSDFHGECKRCKWSGNQ